MAFQAHLIRDTGSALLISPTPGSRTEVWVPRSVIPTLHKRGEFITADIDPWWVDKHAEELGEFKEV